MPTDAPPLAYFDTSVIVKRYVEERGSPLVRRLLWQHRVLSSAIAPVELISAICQRRTAGTLRPQVAAALLSGVRVDRLYWQLADVSEPILTLSEELVQTRGLRALDAIHVASAQIARAVSGDPLPFVTADARQRDVAVQTGFDVIWVE